jgi:hypothetical protein
MIIAIIPTTDITKPAMINGSFIILTPLYAKKLPIINKITENAKAPNDIEVSLTNGVMTATANKIFEISKKYLPNSLKDVS